MLMLAVLLNLSQQKMQRAHSFVASTTGSAANNQLLWVHNKMAPLSVSQVIQLHK